MSSSSAPSGVGTVNILDGRAVQSSREYSSYSLPVAADTDDFGFEPAPVAFSLRVQQSLTPKSDGIPDFNLDLVEP